MSIGVEGQRIDKPRRSWGGEWGAPFPVDYTRSGRSL